MTGRENEKKYMCMDNSSPVRQVKSRPSIFRTLEEVKEQVEFQCFTETREANGRRWTYTDPLYEELCLIIAEVLVMNPDAEIKVAGAEVNGFIVQEVFGRLNNDHLRTVVHNFQRVSYEVKSKKAYLRTALYNAVFETDSSVTNDLARSMPGFFERGRGD